MTPAVRARFAAPTLHRVDRVGADGARIEEAIRRAIRAAINTVGASAEHEVVTFVVADAAVGEPISPTRYRADRDTYAVPSFQAAGEPVELPVAAGTPGGGHEQRIVRAVQEWSRAAQQTQNPVERAYYDRIVLLLQFSGPESFVDDAAVEAFIHSCEELATSEADTLVRLGAQALAFTRAFPQAWSLRVQLVLRLDIDIDALREQSTAALREMESVAADIPAEIVRHGLPVPYDAALTLRRFELQVRHVHSDGVTQRFALAVRAYVASGGILGFYAAWDAMAVGFARAVAEGRTIVDFGAYQDFADTKRQGLVSLQRRLREIQLDEAFASLDAELIDLRRAAFVQAFASAIVGLVTLFNAWARGKAIFARELARVDPVIASAPTGGKIYLAVTWASERGYFGDAGEQILRALLERGWEILATAAVFIVAQFIPVVNVIVDVYVLITSGVDLVQAIAALRAAFIRVRDATTVVALQRASAQMASSLLGDGLRALMDVAAVVGTTGVLRGKMDRLRATNPAMSEEEALRRVLHETPEAAALQRGRAAQAFLKSHGGSNTARRALAMTRGEVADAEHILLAMSGDASADLAVVDRYILEGATAEQRAAVRQALDESGRSIELRRRLLVESGSYEEIIASSRRSATPSAAEPRRGPPAPQTNRFASRFRARPPWRLSERDVGRHLGPDWIPQARYQLEERIRRIRWGSTQPDFYNEARNISAEVKNWDLVNYNRMIENIVDQAGGRVAHLPGRGSVEQWLFVELRGQTVGDLSQLAVRIRRDTGSIFTHLHFILDDAITMAW